VAVQTHGKGDVFLRHLIVLSSQTGASTLVYG
jgi:hypothetical protein